MSLHVIQRGNNRIPIFHHDVDYEIFLAILRKRAAYYGVAIHGYVLMTNHYHLIVTPADESALAVTMQSVGGRYVRYFNRKYERVGTLWCCRYRGLMIDDERYWLTCLRYVEQNPVRAQIVRTPDAYRWSSYSFHGLGASSGLVQPHRLYLSLGRSPEIRQAAYRSLCESPVTDADIAEQRTGPR
jgi:putative transposase